MRKKDLKGILGDLEEPTQEKQLKIEGAEEAKALEEIVKKLIIGCEEFFSGDRELKSLANLDITPQAVSGFLQRSELFDAQHKFSNVIGDYITRLIQASYDTGHNDFELDIRPVSCKISGLCMGLAGRHGKPVKIKIIGIPGIGKEIPTYYYPPLNQLPPIYRSDSVARIGLNKWNSMSEATNALGQDAKNCIFTVDSYYAFSMLKNNAGPDCKIYFLFGKKKVLHET